jgi:hypothetical protein
MLGDEWKINLSISIARARFRVGRIDTGIADPDQYFPILRAGTGTSLKFMTSGSRSDQKPVRAYVMSFLADRRYSRLVEAFDLFKNLLPLASFGGVPYGVDEAGVVKCVVKPGCAVSALSQISYKMSVDLTHVDHRTHEPTGDRGLRCHEWNV